MGTEWGKVGKVGIVEQHSKAIDAKLEKGKTCLLNVTGRHFQVEILEVGSDTVRVTFPGRDYPVEGISAILEFHDSTGYTYYTTEVEQGPTLEDSGIVLRQRSEAKRSLHRDCFRAPTDLTVQIKDHEHVRKYDAALLNISGGGCLIKTEAEFDFSTMVDMTLSLPGESTTTVLGQIVHVAQSHAASRTPSHLYGVRFVDLAPDIEQMITRYMWDRLRDMYPPEG